MRLGAQWHRLIAREGRTSENLDTGLDGLSPGSDDFVNISKDNKWLVAQGTRFGCTSTCLDEVAGDLSKGGMIPAGIVTDGRPAVSSGGNVVVFPARGTHGLDLYAIKQSGGAWTSPVLLTGASSFDYHHDASISADGSRVVFDCGADRYGQPPSSICEVATDGTGFYEVLSPSAGPDGSSSHALHHPDYTPEGDFVFEADWTAEQVWKLVRGQKSPFRVSPGAQNDNSPCVLPDGRIASLWLDRPGNPGYHELKVMNADGTGSIMILTGQDILDVGIGCGN
jgi:hypothetical protein